MLLCFPAKFNGNCYLEFDACPSPLLFRAFANGHSQHSRKKPSSAPNIVLGCLAPGVHGKSHQRTLAGR